MTVIFRARGDLLRMVRDDLHRPHAFAAERVGFLLCRAGQFTDGGLAILAADYDPVRDMDYLDDPRVGAMMGSAAIRRALEHAYNSGKQNIGIFHIHMHNHSGRPGFSHIDLAENKKFVPDFFNAAPAMPHGAIVLSRDEAVGQCWRHRHANPDPINRFVSVAAPLQIWRTE